MRAFVFIAAFTLVLAGAIPRLLEHVGKGAPAPTQAMTARPAPEPAVSSGGRSFTARAGRNGHFYVEARVDGRRIDFVVDTGASYIAIPEREAARLGIHPTRRDYTARMSTANGVVLGAPTRLNMVEVGGLMVRDVAAVVMPDAALRDNLLGMSYLSRLRRFEIANGKLVLEQ